MAMAEEPQSETRACKIEESETEVLKQVVAMPTRLSLGATSASTTIEDDDSCVDLDSCTSSWQLPAADWQLPASVLIFVDWDDTLCPTSWIASKPGFKEWATSDWSGAHGIVLDEADRTALKELDIAATGFLEAASRLGKVCCVTLAQPAWVPACLAAFMPGLAAAWRGLGVDVHYASAEKMETRRGCDRAAAWCLHRLRSDDDERRVHQGQVLAHRKQRSMKRVLRQFYGKHGMWSNVMSFGDGPFERQALQDLAYERSSLATSPTSAGDPTTIRVKTVKMLDEPGCAELCRELQVLQNWIANMVMADDDIDMDLAEVGVDGIDVQSQLRGEAEA